MPYYDQPQQQKKQVPPNVRELPGARPTGTYDTSGTVSVWDQIQAANNAMKKQAPGSPMAPYGRPAAKPANPHGTSGSGFLDRLLGMIGGW